MAEDKKNLYYLHELSDYKVASQDSDVRGWDIKDADNRVIGKVDNLLVNKRKDKVVYLDVEVDKTIIDANHDPYGRPNSAQVHEFINSEGENHIIIPIGLVRLNEEQKYVYAETINHQTFAETKRFEKGRAVDREYETVVLESYDRFGDPEKRKRELEEEQRNFETKPDDSYDEDFRSDETQRRKENLSRDADVDDDYFYERDEFDDSFFRKRRNDR